MRKWALLGLVIFYLVGCSYLPSKNKGNDSQYLDESQRNGEQLTPPSITSNPNKNFLLVGVDSRGEEHSRSDAIMIVRYEPKDRAVKLVSLMRDSYVKIPNYEYQYSKLNHAYYQGGKDLLKKTIEENFDIEIDHVAIIDFSGFVEVINTIAPNGIKVNVSQGMIDDFNLSGEPGIRTLKGKELLAYVRFRHDDQSDFGRVNRQQEILLSLKDHVVEQLNTVDGLVKIPDILTEVLKHVETDLKMQEYLSLGASFVLDPITNVETLRIPVTNSYENKNYDHAGAVLQLDLEENRQAIKLFFEDQAQ